MPEPTRNALQVIMAELSPLEGKALLDIGCGKGALHGPLTQAGAQWRGIDPVATDTGLPIDAAPAQKMPYPDNSFDAAICVNALHHVPVGAMDAALREAARVLRPGALLVVIEPQATGALSQVIAVVDDETVIRAAAQEAMDRTTALVQITAYDYARADRYAGFDRFCDVLISVDPARAPEIAAQRDALRQSFEDHARPVDGGWTLAQPMSVRVFRPA
ncbi:class I SAM-dependent methyltransferase [Sulfitobacter sp. F26169L]|uniref:class I SAM-dependent methyltransferase n=1 Tax=Sulfitobacter sp. F26169L TaxID=2996015 RepID=UPI002260BB58|nr:class I SAM-dependent methyltransferase [Sulfitobacter sp. F26169L]MCX7568132.1 class I SAM-dependent methyltransferase [Sulfitobacter sp. F26169L]